VRKIRSNKAARQQASCEFGSVMTCSDSSRDNAPL